MADNKPHFDYYSFNLPLHIRQSDYKRLEKIAETFTQENHEHGIYTSDYTPEKVLKCFCCIPDDYLNDKLSALEYNRGLITEEEWNQRKEIYNKRLEEELEKSFIIV